MNEKQSQRMSKFLSLILRHKPETVGVELDKNGWTEVETLLIKLNESGTKLDQSELAYLVNTSDKKRFAISECGKKIRANQGHSIKIDLAYDPAEPPEFLFHGTPLKVLSRIRANGLSKMKRHHVHMNAAPEPCIAVAQRYGKPVILKIHAARMHASGFAFFVSANQVWLTEKVPPEYIDFPDQTN